LKFPEEEYRLPFFSENGFLRKQCSICGEYFWTQDFHKKNCGDAPCQDYDFIENSPTKKKYSLSEMREAFISFFEKNSHKRIQPYPIIARWRDDLYVTIASIADFQPYVTEGIIPPPANPLVISQPCLRFLDIDKVGSTAGRHMTIFEMGGHHAFNYPNQEIYWKNETVRLHHEFMTEELGIRSDLISYKEGTWEGGGNAGPDLEGCVKGLEATTLVFMKYKILNGKYYDMPIRVVDTGYGMERLTWLSQGSQSGFHAVYDYLLNRIVNMVPKLNAIPQKAVILNSKLSTTGRAVSSEVIKQELVELTSVDTSELAKYLKLLNSVYTVLDHSKALIFMLAEGIVPSNVKVGYLSRLLFRRTYRLLRLLSIEDKLSELIEMQIKYWSNDFPVLYDMQYEILTAVSVEEHKYRDTLQRGERLVYRLAEQLTKNKAKFVSIDKLIELYESHGVAPEFVSDIMDKQNISVKVPDDFYTLLAKRHGSTQEPPEKPIIDLPEVPVTYPMYYDDAYIKEFKSKVLRFIEFN
jgi:alanyl-tRNA synthetase